MTDRALGQDLTDSEREDLLERSSRGDLDAMKALAAAWDPTYVEAMRHAFHEVLGEQFDTEDDWG